MLHASVREPLRAVCPHRVQADTGESVKAVPTVGRQHGPQALPRKCPRMNRCPGPNSCRRLHGAMQAACAVALVVIFALRHMFSRILGPMARCCMTYEVAYEPWKTEKTIVRLQATRTPT